MFPPRSALRSSIFHCVTGRFAPDQEAHPVSQAPPIPAPAEKAVTGVGAVLTCRGDGPGRWLCSLFQTRGLWDKKSGAALFGAAAVTSLVHPSVPHLLLQPGQQVRDYAFDFRPGLPERFLLARLRTLLQKIFRGPVELREFLRSEEPRSGDQPGADGEILSGVLKVSFIIVAIVSLASCHIPERLPAPP